MVVVAVFVFPTVDGTIAEKSTSVYSAVVISAAVANDELFLSVVTGNVLVSAVVSTVAGGAAVTVEYPLILLSIPRGVAVTSPIFCTVFVADAVVARVVISSPVVTGAVDGFVTVVRVSAITVKRFGFVSAVVAGVVVVGKPE